MNMAYIMIYFISMKMYVLSVQCVRFNYTLSVKTYSKTRDTGWVGKDGRSGNVRLVLVVNVQSLKIT